MYPLARHMQEVDALQQIIPDLPGLTDPAIEVRGSGYIATHRIGDAHSKGVAYIVIGESRWHDPVAAVEVYLYPHPFSVARFDLQLDIAFTPPYEDNYIAAWRDYGWTVMTWSGQSLMDIPPDTIPR